MTVYKAVRNGIIALIIASIALGAGLIGFISYEVYSNQDSSYAVSRLGSTGSEVKSIQQKLASLGYYNGSIDGVYGNATKNAVVAFQRNCGITADGICGKTTLLYLGLGGSSGGSGTSTQYSSADVELLAKVISAEARGESYEGQVAVGAVILNRVKHPSFPDSISGVVYQNGAFSCVNDSNWYAPVADSAKRAAIDAINGWDPSGGAIYYFNAAKTNDAFMHSRPVIKTIGDHKFCM
ncbi:MAG: spore cortex-lytic enzyme [Eubacterium sp.]